MTHIGLGRGREFDLIRSFLHPERAAAAHVRVGPGDDCAVISGDAIALTVDMSVEGVHFRRDWLEPEEIGYRATAAALSDLAAMAALPLGVLVALGVRAEEAVELAPRIMAGSRAAAHDCGAALIGGDLTRSPGPIIIDVVAAGEAAAPVLRSGARAGDALWVTGSLGAAAAAVRAWQQRQTPAADARAAFARPTPRIREARWLAERAVLTSLIDLSDGLAGDAGHIAAASGVRLVVHAAAVPVHDAARSADAGDIGTALALSGGEDYELCFTAADGAVEAVAAEFTTRFGLTLTRVGSVEAGEGVAIVDADGSPLHGLGGYDHFQGAAG